MSAAPKRSPNLICGIDEVGRGPLAGPVTAAAVILSKQIEGLDDSKRLSPRRRERLRIDIEKHAVSWAIAHASPEEIDRLNILYATFLAMSRAWIACTKAVHNLEQLRVFVDGNRCPELPVPCNPVIGGDRIIPAIMAASILAKTERDRIMVEYHDRWPEYGFDRHKGYPTDDHRRAYAVHGPSPIHRQSFRVSPPKNPDSPDLS